LSEQIADNRSSQFAPHIALIAVQIFFGTWPIIGKFALRALPSTGLVALRVGGAALAFALLGRIIKQNRITLSSDYARLALYSLLGVVLNQFLFVKGLALSTVINATILSAAIPAFALAVSVVFGYERLSRRKIVGIVLAAAGVIYLVDPLRADFSGGTTLGNFLLVFNALAYGAYIAISKDMVERYGALTVITWIFLFASLVAIPVGGYHLAQIDLASVSREVWFSVVYIILVPTVAAYYLNALALSRVQPSTVAAYIYLQPLIAFALSPLFLGEELNSRALIATILIFTGVAISTRRKATTQSDDNANQMI
jgi:drug/metabolite transporter (DMT)-like permease